MELRIPKRVKDELKKRAKKYGYASVNKLCGAILKASLDFAHNEANPAEVGNWVERMLEEEFGEMGRSPANRKEINERI